jgi:hypothetical protein
MEVTSYHIIKSKEIAKKAQLKVDKIRLQYRMLGYEVDNRPVNGNGVDLVCYKKLNVNDFKAYLNGKRVYEHIILWEITNWNRRCFRTLNDLKRMIKNLEEGEEFQRKLHPNAFIEKTIVFSYKENLTSHIPNGEEILLEYCISLRIDGEMEFSGWSE